MSATATSRGWLFGPVPDLVIGCGLGYAVVFVLQLLDPALLRTWVPASVAPLVVLLSGTPHYGATLLRVYERAEDRRAYALFTVWATLALVALFFAGLASALVGSILLTVYLTWSPWHYSGQNYGVALMFLGRRGVSIPPLTKRLYYATFFLAFVLTFFAQQGISSAPGYAPNADGGGTIRLLSLGIPAVVTNVALVVAGSAYAVLLVVVFGTLLRRASLRDVAPTLLLTATQALWFAVPVLVRHWGLFPGAAPFAAQDAAYAFLWVAAGHSLQYLWVTTFYAARSEAAVGRMRYLGKSLLAGAALWNVPMLVFGAGGLGWSRSGAALAALVASVVNLHHFVLDGAIWKLRDGRVAQILLRARQVGPTASDPAALEPRAGVPWLRNVVWVLGVVGVAFVLMRTWEREIGFRAALKRGDLARAEQAADRLSRVGLDEPNMRLTLARAATQLRQPAVARQQLERSLALAPTTDTYLELGRSYESEGNFVQAERAYAAALEGAPDDVGALHRRGVALLALGRPDEAQALLERAVSLAPDQKLIAMNLARARARAAPLPETVDEPPLPAAPPLAY